MKQIVPVLLLLCFAQIKAMAQPAAISTWKKDAIGAIWNATRGKVAYGKKDSKGIYKIYLSDSLGNNEQALNWKNWPAGRQQWPQKWHPSGNYIFCCVEKAEYVKEEGHKRKPVDAMPGYGAYSDIWLVSIDGKNAWQLTDYPNNYTSAITHAALSDDGTLFAWTERVDPPHLFKRGLGAGGYVFRVADVVLDSVPHFANIRTYTPGGKPMSAEVESISKDKTTLAFYSTFETKSLFATPIYTLNMVTGDIKKLTEKSFAQCPTFTPDGKHIVYMTGDQCDIFPFEVQGADWWIMDIDGSHKRRLTFMNKRNHYQSVNHYRLAGTLSFMSDNSFLGAIMTSPFGLTGYTAKIVFE